MAEPRKLQGSTTGRLDIRAADVVDLLAKRNPDASDAQVAFTARLMALVGEAAQKPELRALSGQSALTMLPAVLVALSEIDASASVAAVEVIERSHDAERKSPVQRRTLMPRGPVECLQGTGLGERISFAEGRERLVADATPHTLEAWAGPLAGPNEIAERFGIARSTLQDWRRSGAVVGLLRGKRKHVFPLAQFVDGRPVQGLDGIVAIIGDARTAWLWLVEPDRDGRSHLDDLKRGRIEVVTEAAREDFA